MGKLFIGCCEWTMNDNVFNGVPVYLRSVCTSTWTLVLRASTPKFAGSARNINVLVQYITFPWEASDK